MKKYFTILIAILIISCSSLVEPDNIINEDKKTEEILIYNVGGELMGIIRGYALPSQFSVAAADGQHLVLHSNQYILLNGMKVDSLGGIMPTDYQTSDGSKGKTITEEYKDGDGKVHTKVYKNGLLVSLKINGVEQ